VGPVVQGTLKLEEDFSLVRLRFKEKKFVIYNFIKPKFVPNPPLAVNK